jgi:ISXO2-like transposase domain
LLSLEIGFFTLLGVLSAIPGAWGLTLIVDNKRRWDWLLGLVLAAASLAATVSFYSWAAYGDPTEVWQLGEPHPSALGQSCDDHKCEQTPTPWHYVPHQWSASDPSAGRRARYDFAAYGEIRAWRDWLSAGMVGGMLSRALNFITRTESTGAFIEMTMRWIVPLAGLAMGWGTAGVAWAEGVLVEYGTLGYVAVILIALTVALLSTGKRRCVVAMRERGGRTLPFVVITEDQAVPLVRQVVKAGSTVYADESASWNALHAFYDARRINHSIAFHDEGTDTNQAESFFSRLRRAEIGQHHRIGVHLHQYAGEMVWREDNRRKDNRTLFLNAIGAALGHPVSRSRCGYWQRREGITR